MDANDNLANGSVDVNPQVESPGSIEELRSKLVAKEKLAFIGELTAGILHEIKNPLNFVNNFSRLTLDLLTELQESIQSIQAEVNEDTKADIEDIISSLNGNINKILENGDRAERIILNMLAQARENNTINFVPYDVNQLVDDFVKLGYQGMRGTNKNFNLSLNTKYDPAIGKVNVDAHDLGRVILNIVNNACYALDQKKKQEGDGFAPEIAITTKKNEGTFAILIKDNGTGIPDNVLNKIFQPFFTTKPVYEGTGLGLSMSNDIIKNIHKGKLEVNSVAGEFTEFIITIPTNLTS